jgi:tetratricopeptide (TPR) repeat protein
VRLDAGSSEDWAALAHIRTNFLADYAGGEQAAVQAVNIDRENGGAWLDLALSRNQLQAEGAITAAEEAAKLTKSVQARLLLAHLRVTAGQGASALELATSAAAEATLEGDKAWAQSIQAAALTSIGKTEDAIEAFQAADATLKDSAEHNLWYGYALQKNGDLSGAQERFSSAAALTRGTGTPLSARINSDAQKAMKVVAKTTRTKVDSDVAKTKEKPTDDTTARKPMPPVIEENGNGNGQTEPMPVEVPAPR